MDKITAGSNAQEDWPSGVAPDCDEDDQPPEAEDLPTEAFEPTLLWLDQNAAARLAALAGL
jgi:hypothetical protein